MTTAKRDDRVTREEWHALVSRTPDAPANARLIAAGEAKGLCLRVVHPGRLPPPLSSAAPRIALCRLPSGTPDDILGGLVHIERDGQAFLNRPSVLARAHDKHRALLALSDAGLPVPPTLRVARNEEARLDALPGERFVVKPLRGASGRGVTIGLNRELALRCATAFADASGPVIVQPLIGDGTDRRLFVVGEDVVAAFERRPSGRDGRGNLVYGARAAPIVPSDEERQLAHCAMRALDLDLAGVDLLLDGKRPVLLEVNTCPGLEGVSSATGQDVAGAIVRLLAERAVAR
jgi:ribosomal protein S6--L-glutamate ligase